jgi:hypothetical protein
VRGGKRIKNIFSIKESIAQVFSITYLYIIIGACEIIHVVQVWLEGGQYSVLVYPSFNN